MSKSYSLDEFLFAIKASIYRANRNAWMQHLKNLKRYFKPGKNGVLEPIMLKMMLPKTEVSDDKIDVEENHLPYASLVEHTPLTMANLTVEFECYIDGLTEKSSRDDITSVSLIMEGERRDLPKAKFSIEYKSNDDSTEGIARINDKLLKHF